MHMVCLQAFGGVEFGGDTFGGRMKMTTCRKLHGLDFELGWIGWAQNKFTFQHNFHGIIPE